MDNKNIEMEVKVDEAGKETIEKKQSFWEKLHEKRMNWCERHPVAVKVIKGVGGAGLFAGGVLTGALIFGREDDDPENSIEEHDNPMLEEPEVETDEPLFDED